MAVNKDMLKLLNTYIGKPYSDKYSYYVDAENAGKVFINEVIPVHFSSVPSSSNFGMDLYTEFLTLPIGGNQANFLYTNVPFMANNSAVSTYETGNYYQLIDNIGFTECNMNPENWCIYIPTLPSDYRVNCRKLLFATYKEGYYIRYPQFTQENFGALIPVSGIEDYSNYCALSSFNKFDWLLAPKIYAGALESDSRVFRENVRLTVKGNIKFACLPTSEYDNTSTARKIDKTAVYYDFVNFLCSSRTPCFSLYQYALSYFFGMFKHPVYVRDSGLESEEIYLHKEDIQNIFATLWSVPVVFTVEEAQNGILPDLPSGDAPPYEDGGTSSTGGGGGSFDDTSDPVDFTPLPSASVITSGFVGLYNPTVLQLQNLANYLWNDTLLDIDQLRKLVANPMDLLISLTIVPVKPQVTGAETIKVGWRDTGVTMNKISKQFMQFNFGSIDISEYFGSALDYAPFTKISIYLPYIGLKQLNVDEVMNNTIELQYNIDLFTGACVAEIKVGNAVLYSFNGNIANQIPITAESFDSFLRAVIGAVAAVGVTVASAGAGGAVAAGSMAGEAGATATGLSAAGAASIGTTSANAVLSSKPDIQHAGSMASNTGYMANKRPYILIEYPRMSIPENYQNYSGYPCNVTLNLGTLSGYTAISDIHLDGIPATDTELEELETLLKGGIII